MTFYRHIFEKVILNFRLDIDVDYEKNGVDLIELISKHPDRWSFEKIRLPEVNSLLERALNIILLDVLIKARVDKSAIVINMGTLINRFKATQKSVEDSIISLIESLNAKIDKKISLK